MTTKSCRMKGMPWISPYVCVEDVLKSIQFYQDAYGFEVIGDLIPNEAGIVVHCEMKHQDAVMMIGKQGAWENEVIPPSLSKKAAPISLYIYCEDVDAFCLHAQKHGAEIVSAPENTFWGDRMCRLKDLNGYVWAFATHLESTELPS